MPYDALAIANYFVCHAKSHGSPITPMKLQKLIFFAHGWHLAIKDSPLLNEQVEAWAFGPVIRSVYRAFREYGDKPIDQEAVVLRHRENPTSGHRSLCVYTPTIDDSGPPNGFAKSLLSRVWDIYGGYTAIELSNMTHEENTPWAKIVAKCKAENGGELLKGTDVPTEFIKDYFRLLASRNRSPR